jgi:hypothetical protein
MQNTNIINGLFAIPDEGSFLKKLILNNPTTYNPDIITTFKALQEIHPHLELVHKDKYFSLLLPTQSEGLQLEAMLITTKGEDHDLFSIYHRLHFDAELYPQGPRVIEADAFLRLSSIVVNAPLKGDTNALISFLNYQVQEALNIEITMLSLADSNTDIVEENVLPFINNAIGRYMLASTLDDTEYIRPMSTDELSRLVAGYCDIPLVNVAVGIEKLEDFMDDIIRSEDAFIPNFASSTIALMFLFIEKKTSSAILEKGSFRDIKEFLLDKNEIYKLKDITAKGESLGSFTQLHNE